MIVDFFFVSLKIFVFGMDVQLICLCIVLENLVNVCLIGEMLGLEFYCCKMVSFVLYVDCVFGVVEVKIQKIFDDISVFNFEFDFGNLVVNKDGYVKMLNVNLLIEMVDMCEVNCSYEVNFQVIKQVCDMISFIIDFLRSLL